MGEAWHGTCRTERAAQIELGKLLEQADAGRRPETDATVAQLMDRYAEVADWDLSTRKANEVYIRRVITASDFTDNAIGVIHLTGPKLSRLACKYGPPVPSRPASS